MCTTANAVHLFPNTVMENFHLKPKGIFDIVISNGSNMVVDQWGNEVRPQAYVAALVYGDPRLERRTAAVSPEAKEVQEALEKLLRVLVTATTEKYSSKLRTVERGSDVWAGTVDMEL